VRPATSEDVDDVLELVRACVAHMRRHGIEQWDERYPDRTVIEADARGGEAFVATHEAGLIGYVALGARQDPAYAEVPWTFSEGPIVVIQRLMVDPVHQGRGFAKALMAFAEQHARRSGYRSVRLDAFIGNPNALQLYDRLGYRSAGVIRHRTGRFRCFERELAENRMSEPKTKPTDVSVEDHLAAIANEERRNDAQRLVALMRGVTEREPRMWGPTIVGFGSYHYRYASGHQGDAPLAGFAIRGREIVVYIEASFEGREDMLAKLGKHRTGKVCVYVRRLADVDMEVLETLVARSVAETKRRYP
jgi:GNAT superfamily N-acetyltransferase